MPLISSPRKSIREAALGSFARAISSTSILPSTNIYIYLLLYSRVHVDFSNDVTICLSLYYFCVHLCRAALAALVSLALMGLMDPKDILECL